MAGINNTAAPRILIIQNDKASLYVWKKQKLRSAGHFNADVDGLKTFSEQIGNDLHSAIDVVVDCIEEDFRHETVAHVQGRDRNEMLNRKQSLLFRNTPYRIAKLLGRETSGRRDDKVLFSALSKPDIVSYWLDPILTARIAVRAITSASYLIEYLARQKALHSVDHLLVVSVESSSGIRQTYLQKGKLMFSRLLPMRPGQDSSLFVLIEEQSIQTRKYLERIKLMPYDQAMKTVVYMDASHNDLPGEHVSEQMHFSYSDTSTLDGYALVEAPEEESVGCMLSVLAQRMKKASITNTYGPLSDRRYHILKLAYRGLLAASAILVVAVLVTSSPVLMEGLNNSEQTQSLQLRTRPLLSDYERLRQSFPDTPIPSNSMALIVETYDKLETPVIDARSLMASIGRVLSASPNVRISNLEWSIGEQSASDRLNLSESQQFVLSSINNNMQIKVLLEGNVLETFSVREAHEQVTGFIDAIEQQTGGVVTPLSLPLDVSAVSTLELTLDDAPVPAGFVLELLIVPPSQRQSIEEDGV